MGNDFAKPFGYTLKEEQRKVLCSFVGGEKVFAVLPTGYSKSLCYQCLPLFMFDSLRANGVQSVILVISPLVAIIKDQVRKHPSWCNHGCHMNIVLLTADLYLHVHVHQPSIPQNAPLLTFSKVIKTWSKEV